jgi:acetyl esterase/lipase
VLRLRRRRPAEAGHHDRLLEAYGPEQRQYGEWWAPPASFAGRRPLVVLVHGGYWRADYDLHLQDAVAGDLADRGFLVWNIDYAPSTQKWPATLNDVAAGYDSAFNGAYRSRIDRRRVAVVGHSAGGHLALWLASRSRLPIGAPGATAHARPTLAVPQAPVASLHQAAALGLGSDAVQALLGGSPTQVPARFSVADPVSLAPSGVRTVLIHGPADDIVPISQSTDYLAVARDCTLEKVPGDHFAHLDPASSACAALRAALATL